MMRERLFELIKEAGLERVQTCCPGVEYKLCSNDVWKGDLSSLVGLVEAESRAQLLADPLAYDKQEYRPALQTVPLVANKTTLAPSAIEAIRLSAAMLKTDE